MQRRISKRKAALLILVIALCALWMSGCAKTSSPPPADGQLQVHFIDVDQGDATLLQGPDFTILIDAGRHDRDDVVPYLRSVGIEQIDLLVGTHPHSDHIGQFDRVLQHFPVQEVWMSGDEHTSHTYERALDAILESEAGYVEPKRGERYEFGSALIEIVHPDKLTGDLNGGSVSMRIRFGNVAFLFTGDAESEQEQSMIESGLNLRAHIFHAGHHGSSTSNTEAFLRAVSPDVAIISAGNDNPYGHPHTEVVERLEKLGIDIFRTDRDGTIIVVTDGRSYEVRTSAGTTKQSAVTATNEPVAIADRVGHASGDEETSGPGCRADQIDLNEAAKTELQRIIHIGESRAAQIVELREEQPFDRVEDLARVTGISAERLQDIVEQDVACVGQGG